MKTDVRFCGLDLEVHYDWQPEEKQVTYYADYSGYPGCAESLDINAVMLGEHDITELFVEKNLLDDLEDAMRKIRYDDI